MGRARQKWLISDISEVLKGVDSQVKTEDSNKDWHSLSKECRPFVMPFTDAPSHAGIISPIHTLFRIPVNQRSNVDDLTGGSET